MSKIKQKKNWQLAIFAYTIFAVKVLNFSVRYGKRCIHFAIVTNQMYYNTIVHWKQDNVITIKLNKWLNCRSISISQLNISLCLHT